MIDLMNLQPTQISRNLKGKFGMIYGDAGCGKTTLAAEFDKSLIMAFEVGYNALNGKMVQPIATWTEWKSAVKQLCNKTNGIRDKFHTICIDTADEAYKLCEKYVCNQAGVESIKDVAGFGKQSAALVCKN